MQPKIITPILIVFLSFILMRVAVEAAVENIYVVNLTTDAGDANPGDGICDSDLSSSGSQCTFRAAVDEANADPDYDLIGLPAGVFNIDDDAIEILTGTVEIRGAFNNSTILDGSNSDSGLLFIRPGGVVTATRLTFQNGSGGCFPAYGCAMGGAISNDGVLALDSCLIRDNHVSTNGGGIKNEHHLTITNCTFENNRAGQVGGAIYSAGYNNTNTLTVRDTMIRDNFSTGGGGLYVADAVVLIENSTIQHNAAFGTPTSNSYGGGLSIKSSSDPFTVTIRHTVFADNYSEASGGAIFSSNQLTVSATEFRHNRAAQRGGAIFSQIEAPRVSQSLFYGNWAGYEGGAIFQNTADLTLSESALFDNEAQRDGGGLYINRFAGRATLTNVTVSGNAAGRQGGGLFLHKDLTAKYTTVVGNTAPSGSAVAFNGGTLRLGSSIVDDHSSTVCDQPNGTFVSLGHNLINGTGGCTVSPASGDLFGVDPLLGPLQDNGGPSRTLTHAPGAGSPALEAGDAADCPPFDQRGVARPVSSECDAGALEFDPEQDPESWVPIDPLPLFEHAQYPTPVVGRVFTVTAVDHVNRSDNNPGDGTCATGQGSGVVECTLSAAIQESNALAGQDTILLPAGTFSLTSQLDEITDHLVLQGAGSSATELYRGSGTAIRTDYSTIVTIQNVTLRGADRFISNYGKLTLNNCVVSDNEDSAVFSFYSYGDTMPIFDPLPEVTVRRCTFRNNAGAFNGAAIYSVGSVAVYDSLFENNEATNGGAIYTTGGAGITEQGNITIVNSHFEGNVAERQGGAIRSRWSLIDITNSVFINNAAPGDSQSQGGAIATSSWIMITDSYFEGNTAENAGGAIANGGKWNVDIDPAVIGVSGSSFIGNSAEFGGGVVFEGSGSIRRSTFSGNTAERDGGGLLIAADSSAALNSVTIVNNTADSNGDNDGAGGGLQLAGGLWDSPGDFTIQNSIMANNVAFSGDDCSAATGNGISLGGNLIEEIADCGLVTVGSDLIGVDPQLAPLNNVQNHNRAHVPLLTSPAIDSGGGCETVDQRGISRAICDRGAAEVTPPQMFQVNNSGTAGDAEPGNGICETSRGTCTFAAAVEEANVWNFADTIVLSAGSFTSENVVISGGDLTIQGAGAGQTVLIAASGNNRVLTTGLITDPGQKIFLQDLAISGGNLEGATSGGGIFNVADLTLERILINDNQAGSGGAVANLASGSLTIHDSAFVDNRAEWFAGRLPRGTGGALVNSSSGTVTLVNVTISGNEAGQYGGGVAHTGSGSLTLDQVTVADNSANSGYGGGVVNAGSGSLSLNNTIIGNNGSAGGDPDCHGVMNVVRGRVLIENNSVNCQPKSVVLTGDPLLAKLGDNGGGTSTHALLAGSPAVDAGGMNCPAADQRGYSRRGACDLGAYEYGGEPPVEMYTLFLPLVVR
ncbi:MAG: choice-of-anchor Q domain-containing protein [Ardenticatenaceae bacterium]|nr:choice-of-anchor Q domain-containing protein [Ardenticatenaceae bacterium]